MIAPATASPARPPPLPPPERTDAALVPTPRVPASPGDLPLGSLPDLLAGLARPAPAARATVSRPRRPAIPGWAPPPPAPRTSRSASTSGTPKDLSFLKDPRLGIEEKLMRLLGYLNQKWEKEMQAKLDQIAAGETGSASKASASKAKRPGGILGGLASAAKGLLGAAGFPVGLLGNKAVQGLLGKVGGPVLAAAASALGFPALAPTLLRVGPGVLGAVAGAASSAGGGSGGGTTAASAGGMKDSERQQLVLEIQRITERQKEMFGLVSNILKANHDMRSAIIGNIR